jgi:D-alanine--poly(phosphoribitol) ligase subunit 2
MSRRELVFDIIASVTEAEEVRDQPDIDLFASHTLDSLQTVELIVRLSDTFDLIISPAEFDRAAWATPELIARDVERRLAVQAGK